MECVGEVLKDGWVLKEEGLYLVDPLGSKPRGEE